MSTNATSLERIFKIRKQTFRKKIKMRFYEWIVNIEAHDEQSDELHQWIINSNYNKVNSYWIVDLSGFEKNRKVRYERCYCEVEIYINGNEKLGISSKRDMKGPKFNEFYLDSFIYPINYEKINNDIEIFLTISSSDESNVFAKQKILLDEGILTDTIIKTKDREFPCHKFVLASQSEYFKKMFQTNMRESQTNSVNWTGVFDAPVVKGLLHFFYTGQTPPNLKDNHFGLLEAAHLCLLPDLKGICVDSIVPNITVENAAYVLQSAEIYESVCLKTEAVKFVVAHWDGVLASDFYQQLEPGICKRLLKSIFDMLSKYTCEEGIITLP